MPRLIDDLDDAPAIDRAFVIVHVLDPQQRAISDARGDAGLAAWIVDADFRRLAAFHLIPFGGRGGQFAITVPAGDVDHHGSGQHGGLGYFLAALLDRAL